MRIVKYHAQLQFSKLWIIVIYNNVIEKKHDCMKSFVVLTSAKLIRHFKNYYWCLLNMNWLQNVSNFIAIMHVVQKLREEHFWSS